MKDIAMDSVQPPRRTRVGLIVSLSLCALLLSGCGFVQRFFGRSEPPTPEAVAAVEPVPPLQPPVFADFKQRDFLPERISIPAIDLDTPVVELGWSSNQSIDGRIFSQWNVAEYAAGWHINSAPLNQGGNVVLSGHNNILGSVFRELDQLKQGDRAEIWSNGARFEYAIDKVMIVPDEHATREQRLDNAKWIHEFDDDRLTLVSCWPRDDNTHRIIVVGHRLDNEESVGSNR